MRTKKLKTIEIKGKKYTTVHERILHLANTYDNYSLVTEAELLDDKIWKVKATLTIGESTYIGHGAEIIGDNYINKTSALENAETSAWGRACAAAGIGINTGIASGDEMNKTNRKPQTLEDSQDKDEKSRLIKHIVNAEKPEDLIKVKTYVNKYGLQGMYDVRLKMLQDV